MTTVSELRNITLKARGENSNGRLEQYTKARDEAFNLITDGVMDRIKEAASSGKFRYPIYRWQNTPRFQKDDEEQKQEETDGSQDNTKVFFGNSADSKNGLHIMSLINPKGIDRQHSLITKLREFFNSDSESSDEQRDNQLKVYFEPHPVHFRKCAIFVSWDRKQVHRPSYGGIVQTSDTRRSPVKGGVAEHFASLKKNDDESTPIQKKRFVVRGLPRTANVKRN